MAKNTIISQAERTINQEYHKLNEQWLKTQYNVIFGIVLSVVVVELAIFSVLQGTDAITESAGIYFLKYVIPPLLINLALLWISRIVLKSEKYKHITKIYVMTLSISVVCTVVYITHHIFTVLFLVLTLPMIMTIIYADSRLTTIISLVCILEKAIADIIIGVQSQSGFAFFPYEEQVNFFLSFVALGIVMAICITQTTIERNRIDVSVDLIRERVRLRKQVVTDPLTGVGNRQALRKAMNELETHPEKWYVLAMIDFDRFKELNDTNGHGVGDKYLTAFGELLTEETDERIHAFRFGGDEFCMLFRDMRIQDCHEICRRLQKNFHVEQLSLDGEIEVTLSIGLAKYYQGEKPSDLLENADEALYQAKKMRNRICVYNQAA